MDRLQVEDMLKDLSTAVISVHANDLRTSSVNESDKNGSALDTDESKGITILVPHSVDGANSLQYAQHIKGIKKIIVGNNHESSVTNIENAISRCGVEGKVVAVCVNANILMYSHHKHKDRFDVVDLDIDDVTRYLDTAVQCVNDGGLLLVTCRDPSLGSGTEPDVCYARYGSLVLPSDCGVEMALRVFVKCVESHANRHMRYTQPVTCVSLGEGCVKICVRVFTSPIVCKQTLSKLSMVHHCTGCKMLTLHPLGIAEQHSENKKRFKFSLPRGPPIGLLCDTCKAEHKIGGPVWHDPLQCPAFISKLYQFIEQSGSNERLRQLVATIRDEMHDVCFYFSLHTVQSLMQTEPAFTMENLRSALDKHHNTEVSSFHGCKESIKSKAPASVVWAAIMHWVKQENISCIPLNEIGRHILEKCTSSDQVETGEVP